MRSSRPKPHLISQRNKQTSNNPSARNRNPQKNQKKIPVRPAGRVGTSGVALIIYDGPIRAAHTVRVEPCAEVDRISRASHGCPCMSQKMMTSPLRSRRGPFG